MIHMVLWVNWQSVHLIAVKSSNGALTDQKECIVCVHVADNKAVSQYTPALMLVSKSSDIISLAEIRQVIFLKHRLGGLIPKVFI
jgi:hypothetical protein